MTTSPSTYRLAWSASLALALALAFAPAAASAQAAPRKATPPPAKKTQAPAAVAPAAQPAPRAAQPAPRAALRAAPAASPLLGALEFTGGLGLAIPFESGVGVGFKLGGGAFLGMKQLQPNMLLQVGGTVAWTYNGYDSPLDGSLMSFDFLPTARLRVALQPQLFVYADGGLGLSFVRAKINIPILFPGAPDYSTSDTSAAFLIKLGGGVGYDLQPNLSLVAEPALNFYLRDGSITQLTLMVGAIYRQ